MLCAKTRKDGLGRWRTACPATLGTKECLWESAWVLSHLTETEARQVLQETHYEFPIEALPILLRAWHDSRGAPASEPPRAQFED
eukprot:1738724-Pyramimonas_sp.AAC.1